MLSRLLEVLANLVDLDPASESGSESGSVRSILLAADLTAEMETMAQRHVSMDDSFHLPNFPHMAWVDPSALPTIVIMPSLRARFECITISHGLKSEQ